MRTFKCVNKLCCGLDKPFTLPDSWGVLDAYCPLCDALTERMQQAPIAAKGASILRDAQQIAGAGAERARDYGHPITNFTRIAKIWSIQIEENLKTNTPLSARQVGLMMAAMKLIREIETPKRDNLIDVAGYCECVGDIDEVAARSGNGV